MEHAGHHPIQANAGRGPALDNAADVAEVRRVGQRISQAVELYFKQQGQSAQLEGYQWEFNLIDDPKTVNAWCMPGGKVAVYSGILPLTRDENGLAVVMAHEISHAVAKHGAERMSDQLAAQLGGTALSTALSQNPTATKNIFQQAVGVGTQGLLLKFSRRQESEADTWASSLWPWPATTPPAPFRSGSAWPPKAKTVP